LHARLSETTINLGNGENPDTRYEEDVGQFGAETHRYGAVRERHESGSRAKILALQPKAATVANSQERIRLTGFF
jgi:hypothetical protein